MGDTAPARGELPRVLGIFIAETAGGPLRPLEAAKLIAGVGIDGDRYATKAGFWSDPKWPDQELTLVESEVEDEFGIDRGALRRNLVTRGIDLNGLMGERFTIGDAILEGVRPCDPCKHIEDLNRPGLLRDLVGHGGLRARIVQGGTIGVGDEMRVLRQPSSK